MSIEKMNAIEEVFRDAYEHTLSHFPDKTRNDVIIKFAGTITMQYSIYLAFTSDGLQRMIRDVFESEVIRDFVFRLTAAFYTRLGVKQQDNHQLVDILSNALCMTSSQTDTVGSDSGTALAIPSDIAQRLPTASDIRDILSANKWVVTTVMIALYLRVETVEPKAKPPVTRG